MNKAQELQRTQLKEALNELGIKNEDAVEFAIEFILEEFNYYNKIFSSTKEDVLKHLKQISSPSVDDSDKDIKSKELIKDVLFSSELERHKAYTEMIASDC